MLTRYAVATSVIPMTEGPISYSLEGPWIILLYSKAAEAHNSNGRWQLAIEMQHTRV